MKVLMKLVAATIAIGVAVNVNANDVGSFDATCEGPDKVEGMVFNDGLCLRVELICSKEALADLSLNLNAGPNLGFYWAAWTADTECLQIASSGVIEQIAHSCLFENGDRAELRIHEVNNRWCQELE